MERVLQARFALAYCCDHGSNSRGHRGGRRRSTRFRRNYGGWSDDSGQAMFLEEEDEVVAHRKVFLSAVKHALQAGMPEHDVGELRQIDDVGGFLSRCFSAGVDGRTTRTA